MSGYYAHVRDCLEAGRNGRFCAGAEKAAAEISRLTAELAEANKRLGYRDRATTHSDECWRWHPGCAETKVASLEAALAERDKLLDEAVRCTNDGSWIMWADLMNWSKRAEALRGKP